MRFICLFFVMAILNGCATSPQSRNELKATAQAHTKMMIYESYTTSHHFEDVISTLQRKWQECYGISRTTSRHDGVVKAQYTDTFHTHFAKVNNSLFAMTLQMTTKGMTMLSKVPPGGDYIVALDVERVSANTTKLTWYSAAWGWKDAWERNKKWSDGKNVPCE